MRAFYTTMKSFSALVAVAVLGTANAGVMTATSVIPSTYKATSVPTSIIFTQTFATALSTTDKIIITQGRKTFWSADGAVVCAVGGSAQTATCASVGAVLTCTATSAIVAAATTLTCTTNIAQNAAAGTTTTFGVTTATTGDVAIDTNGAYGGTAYLTTAAPTTGVMTATSVIPSTYKATSVPTSIIFTQTFATALSSTDKIIITPSATIWSADAAVVCAVGGSAQTATCASVGAVLTCTATSAILAAATTLTCTTNIAQNAAASTTTSFGVTTANTGGDAIDTNGAYTGTAYLTTAAPTTGVMTATTVIPSTYKATSVPTSIIFTQTFATALSSTDKIIITPSATIWSADAAVVCAVGGSAQTATCASVGAVLTCTATSAILAAATTLTCTTNIAGNAAVNTTTTFGVTTANTGGDAIDTNGAYGGTAYLTTAAAATTTTDTTNTTNTTSTTAVSSTAGGKVSSFDTTLTLVDASKFSEEGMRKSMAAALGSNVSVADVTIKSVEFKVEVQYTIDAETYDEPKTKTAIAAANAVDASKVTIKVTSSRRLAAMRRLVATSVTAVISTANATKVKDITTTAADKTTLAAELVKAGVAGAACTVAVAPVTKVVVVTEVRSKAGAPAVQAPTSAKLVLVLSDVASDVFGSTPTIVVGVTTVKDPVCSKLDGAASTTYPCTCGTTINAKISCTTDQLCTATTDADGTCAANATTTVEIGYSTSYTRALRGGDNLIFGVVVFVLAAYKF